METNADGTYFQEGDHVRLKRTQETGRVHGADGGVVYVLMDETNETRLFSAYVDEDAYIELVVFANNGDTALPQISEEEGLLFLCSTPRYPRLLASDRDS
jgi:hypothetical protein